MKALLAVALAAFVAGCATVEPPRHYRPERYTIAKPVAKPTAPTKGMGQRLRDAFDQISKQAISGVFLLRGSK